MFGSSLRVAMTPQQPNPIYNADGVRFGGNDRFFHNGYMSGLSDGKLGIFSFWFKRFSIGNTQYVWEASGLEFMVRFLSSNVLQVAAPNDGSVMDFRTTTAISDMASWHHLLAAWNLGTTTVQLLLDGVDDLNTIAAVNANIDYTRPDHAFGSRVIDSTRLNAEVADPYLNFAETLDISVLANVRKFRNSIGKPVLLGANGELPTGTSPIAHFRGNAAAWNAGHNHGTGGTFSFATGSVTDATSSPSD